MKTLLKSMAILLGSFNGCVHWVLFHWVEEYIWRKILHYPSAAARSAFVFPVGDRLAISKSFSIYLDIYYDPLGLMPLQNIRSLLREKCPLSELFWSAFCLVWTEYGHGEISDQNNSEYGHFLRRS